MVREGSSSCNGGDGAGPSKRQLGSDPHLGALDYLILWEEKKGSLQSAPLKRHSRPMFDLAPLFTILRLRRDQESQQNKTRQSKCSSKAGFEGFPEIGQIYMKETSSRNRCCLPMCRFGDRYRGGGRSNGRVKISNFPGCLKMTPFYRDSRENPHFGGSKVQAFQWQFSGRVPPI